VWDRGEYQAAPAADHGTLKCKMGVAPVFGAPDEIETADQTLRTGGGRQAAGFNWGLMSPMPRAVWTWQLGVVLVAVAAVAFLLIL
jgi:hypothetical protein